eukprot:symbB.v1.2.018079.t1/scaffold1429.1/size119369/7
MEVGPTRVSPIQDSNRWRERALIESSHANQSTRIVAASPAPYHWEEVPMSSQMCCRRAKVPKDLGKEILTANEMMKQALRLGKDVNQDIQAAGIAIHANQVKPSVLPSSASPEWLPPRCETPFVREVEWERQKREEAEKEVQQLKAELRAFQSQTSSMTTTRTSGNWLASRGVQTPRSTPRSMRLDAIHCSRTNRKTVNCPMQERSHVGAPRRSETLCTASALSVSSEI